MNKSAYEIQYHMQRDLEGVLPTCASGNRQIVISPGYGPCAAYELAPAPLGVVWEPLT